jgi:hypothetical protein
MIETPSSLQEWYAHLIEAHILIYEPLTKVGTSVFILSSNETW